MMPKITPFLWFDTQAEEAAQFYTSIFRNSKIRSISRYPEGSPGPAGSVMTVSFELDGQEFTALNAGPTFKFNESVSFVVHCETQAEVDEYWSKLLEGGGTESQCGWLKDRFGLSWQITPNALMEMIQEQDKEKAKRAMTAMLGMGKIDIAGIKRAYDGN
jgi:predicted 3-demethylubiquinone-9 3-methyltransferase (glyoxalase superfamily)